MSRQHHAIDLIGNRTQSLLCKKAMYKAALQQLPDHYRLCTALIQRNYDYGLHRIGPLRTAVIATIKTLSATVALCRLEQVHARSARGPSKRTAVHAQLVPISIQALPFASQAGPLSLHSYSACHCVAQKHGDSQPAESTEKS